VISEDVGRMDASSRSHLSSTSPVVVVATDRGEVKIVAEPAGTRGYEDLRRPATREPLGRGLQPSVASIDDLARMLAPLGREEDREKLRALRRLAELERGLALEVQASSRHPSSLTSRWLSGSLLASPSYEPKRSTSPTGRGRFR
jgi:hypothetical protein